MISPSSQGEPTLYRPLQPLAAWVCLALGIEACVLAGSAFAAWEQHRAASLVEPGDAATSEPLARASVLLLGFKTVGLFVLVVCAILFLVWFHRAHRNLGAFRTPPFEYSDAGAVWGFVVPFASLIYPYWVMQEIWKGSDPSQPRGERAPFDVPASRVAGVWWTAYVLRGGLGWVAYYQTGSRQGLAGVQQADLALILANALGVLAAALCMVLVNRISSRQALCARLPVFDSRIVVLV